MRIARSLLYAVMLLPQSVVAIASGLTGGSRTNRVRIVAYGVASVILGVLAWFLLLLLALVVLRGALYGFVERGPYGPGTWGGPTRAGAWAVHAAIAVPIGLAVVPALHGLGELHARLVRRMNGEPVAGWVVPVAAVVCVAGAVLIVTWIGQI